MPFAGDMASPSLGVATLDLDQFMSTPINPAESTDFPNRSDFFHGNQRARNQATIDGRNEHVAVPLSSRSAVITTFQTSGKIRSFPVVVDCVGGLARGSRIGSVGSRLWSYSNRQDSFLSSAKHPTARLRKFAVVVEVGCVRVMSEGLGHRDTGHASNLAEPVALAPYRVLIRSYPA